MEEKEVWVEHPIGVYVSNKGQVYWESRKYTKGHFTFGSNSGNGYKKVCYKGKTYKVHRLVAESFLPNQDKLPMVNHRDENKANNNVSNLEWCSAKYNLNFGSRTERATKNRDYKAIVRKLSKKVIQMTLDGEIVKEWTSTAECGRNGYHQGNVSACCRNKFNKEGNNIYKGFKWRWA